MAEKEHTMRPQATDTEQSPPEKPLTGVPCLCRCGCSYSVFDFTKPRGPTLASIQQDVGVEDCLPDIQKEYAVDSTAAHISNCPTTTAIMKSRGTTVQDGDASRFGAAGIVSHNAENAPYRPQFGHGDLPAAASVPSLPSTVPRAFRCSACGRFFDSRQSLKNHKRIHQETRHMCSYCGDTFSRSDALLRHERCQHEESKHVCPHCGFACGRKDRLRTHLETHHAGSG
ncbi:hypothetical protein ACOMHN_014207 [Nucella lapillus]